MDESYCRTRSLRLVSQFGLTDTWVVRAFRPASRAFLEPWSPVGAAQENECVVPTALGVVGVVTAGLKARTTVGTTQAETLLYDSPFGLDVPYTGSRALSACYHERSKSHGLRV